jgi:hypothetical protein
LVVLFAVLLAGCDGSGGNGDAPDREPAEPQFDLTGYWSMGEPIDCEFSNLEGLLEALLAAVLDNPEFLTDQMGNELEQNDLESDLSAVTSNEFHIDQMGNDLEVTFESNDGSDAQLHGTIIGDQVHFSQSEERDLQALKVDLHTEIRGTVRDEDRMVLTQESDWVVQIHDREPVTGEINCTFHATRN